MYNKDNDVSRETLLSYIFILYIFIINYFHIYSELGGYCFG